MQVLRRLFLAWKACFPRTGVKMWQGFPDKIIISPYVIKVEILDVIPPDEMPEDEPSRGDFENAETDWGCFTMYNLTIRLKREQPSAAFAVDTIKHEISHAIWRIGSLGDSEDEERAVAVLATGWTRVEQDNPALLEWTRRALHEDISSRSNDSAKKL